MEKAIYMIKNLVNGKIYIGQTIHPKKRWWEHKNRAKTHYDNYPIHLAISKYGEDNFIFSILEWTNDYDNREKELIVQYNAKYPNGYNISDGGDHCEMYGEDHPRNTVGNAILHSVINDLYENKLSDREIAKKYNLTDKIIADINHGYSHRVNDVNYPIRIRHGSQKLTIQQVEEIKEHLSQGDMTYDELAEKYSVRKPAIYHINKGLTYIDENRTYPIRTRLTNYKKRNKA